MVAHLPEKEKAMEKNMMQLKVEELEEVATRALGDGYNEITTNYLRTLVREIQGEFEKDSEVEVAARLAGARLNAFISEFNGRKLDFHTAMARTMAVSDVLRTVNALRFRLKLEIERAGIKEAEAKLAQIRAEKVSK